MTVYTTSQSLHLGLAGSGGLNPIQEGPVGGSSGRHKAIPPHSFFPCLPSFHPQPARPLGFTHIFPSVFGALAVLSTLFFHTL